MAAHSRDRSHRFISIAEQMQAGYLDVMIAGAGVRTAIDKSIATGRSILSWNFSKNDSRAKDKLCAAIQYDGATQIVDANLIDVDRATSCNRMLQSEGVSVTIIVRGKTKICRIFTLIVHHKNLQPFTVELRVL